MRRRGISSVRPRSDVGVVLVGYIGKIGGGEESLKDYVGIIVEQFAGGGVFGKLNDNLNVGVEFMNGCTPETDVFEPKMAFEVDVVAFANVENTTDVDFGVSWHRRGR